MALAPTALTSLIQMIVVRSGKMGMLKVVNDLEETMNEIEESLAELYKQLLHLDDRDLSDKLLVTFGKIEHARELHYESVGELIELIDERVRLNGD